jgi:hypothetical protein
MLGIFGALNQFAVLTHVSKWHAAPHPDALNPAGADLVADALGRHLALELSEGK